MSSTPDSRFNITNDPRFSTSTKKSKKSLGTTQVASLTPVATAAAANNSGESDENIVSVKTNEKECDVTNTKKDKKKSKMRRQAEKYAASLKSRGVIYVSKVPPFMKPNKMRNLFEPYGEVTRLYLAEEDAATRKKRQMNGGNASKQFKEGWVEFSDKKIAKRVAESLNNTQISRKKGDYYHDDIWNLKYLSGFKWDYLTEKFAYERRTREMKLAASLTQAKKANAEFVQLIEKQQVDKMIAGRKQQQNTSSVEDGNDNNDDDYSAAARNSNKKRSSRDSRGGDGNDEQEEDGSGNNRSNKKFKRNFHQARVLGVTHEDATAALAMNA